jgi:hypothetical protein
MDDFLKTLRRDPDPEFARDLRGRLRAQPEPRIGWKVRPVPAVAIAFAAIALVSLFTIPAVRVSAQAVLDLFRVRKFAAVQFDENRIEKLRAMEKGQEPGMLVLERKETLRDPGKPRAFTDALAAGAAAGLSLRRPGYLPNGIALDSAFVSGASETRFAVSEAKLRSLLDALDLRDVSVPMGLDGKTVDVRTQPVVIERFKGGRWTAALVQTVSPEIAAPAGLDIERLGEIGLRVLGLDAGEARRVAQSIDWRTTMVVPVPINASTFRQVTVHGQPGLLVTTTGRGAGENEPHRDGTMVMWTEGDRIFAITGNLYSSDLMEMAESVQ